MQKTFACAVCHAVNAQLSHEVGKDTPCHKGKMFGDKGVQTPEQNEWNRCTQEEALDPSMNEI